MGQRCVHRKGGFQFHLVRLKVMPENIKKQSMELFQFHLVRLKACLYVEVTKLPKHFNSI